MRSTLLTSLIAVSLCCVAGPVGAGQPGTSGESSHPTFSQLDVDGDGLLARSEIPRDMHRLLTHWGLYGGNPRMTPGAYRHYLARSRTDTYDRTHARPDWLDPAPHIDTAALQDLITERRSRSTFSSNPPRQRSR